MAARIRKASAIVDRAVHIERLLKGIWIAAIFLLSGAGGIAAAGPEPGSGKTAADDAEGRKTIEAFLKDPLADTAQGTARKLFAFLEESDSIQFMVRSVDLEPWMARKDPHPVERQVLNVAYFAGNARAQLDGKAQGDDPLSGWEEALRVYALLKEKNGNLKILEVEDLLWLQREGKLAEHLARIRAKGAASPQRKKIRFQNGETTLSGALVLPPGEGPHPAVLFIHGSGPRDRSAGGVYPHYYWGPFTKAGFACLSWDKPGVGKSTGDWKKQTFRDRAEEAIAAVRFLQGQKEIDPKRIGLWGISQGGWVSPLAATLSEDVAFIIPVSGPGGGLVEQQLFSLENELRAEKMPEEEIRKTLTALDAYARSLEELARKDAPFEAAAALAKPIEKEPWFPSAVRFFVNSSEMGPGFTPEQYGFFKLNFRYDPVPVLERVKCPVLAIWGELDKLVPAEKSREIFERCLKKAGNPDVTLNIFPKADHGLLPTVTGSLGEMFQSLKAGKDLAPGYLDTMTGWLQERFGKPAAPQGVQEAK